jgi:DNA-binding FadR family transcriptional regulator
MMQQLPSKGAAVAEQIAAAIGAGELKPGETLEPVQVAARTFAVSPAVIREARQRLDQAGLVQIRHGSGALVNPSSMWRATEVLGRLARRGRPDHAREVLAYLEQELRFEREAARVGALEPDPTTFDALVQARDAFVRVARGAPAGQPLRDYDIADERFHGAIVRLGRDPAVSALSEQARAILVEESFDRRRTSEDVRRDLAEHDDIVAAVGSHDADAAEAATVAHLRGVARRRAASPTWLA